MKINVAPLGRLGANFYMLLDENTNEMIVIDPGYSGDIIDELINKSSAKIKYIILTHAHADHIGALDFVKKKHSAPVVIYSEEAYALNNSQLNLCNALGITSPKTEANILVNDGDKLPFGNESIEFIHTPGHTAGSMCIKISDFLFTGDTLFNLSIGRSDFPGGSSEDLIKSIKNKIYTLPSSTVIYPGHGEPTTVQYEKENNPFVRG